jgi:hypothetical protein
MNRFVFDEDGGFLIVETKWGNLQIEQSAYETSVEFIENFISQLNPSHIEDKTYGNTKIVSMVSDEREE